MLPVRISSAAGAPGCASGNLGQHDRAEDMAVCVYNLYFCYDNEGYGNTAQQYSAATPHAANTATSTACPTGWDYDPNESVEIGHLAVKTGLALEGASGRRTRAYEEAARADACRAGCGRTPHAPGPLRTLLFEPERREEVLMDIQARTDDYWDVVEEREG